MRFRGSGALRCVKPEECTPLERVTSNKWGGQFALSARGGRSYLDSCPQFNHSIVGKPEKFNDTLCVAAHRGE